MADFDSSLPIRTQNNGDVVAFLADGTVPTQLLSIDSSGRISSKLFDGSGVAITSQTNGAQRALDVGINVAGVQIDPRQIRALTSADVVSVVQSTSPWITKDQSDGPVTPGTVASFSQLMGGQYNTVLPTLTNGQQAALQVDSSGRLVISVGSSVTVTNFPAVVDTNYGTVGASTIRTASQLGNATGAADFNAGATGAQTLRVIANQGAANATPWNENIAQIAGAVPSATNALPTQISTGGAFVSSSNPLPVIIDPAGAGTAVCDYKDAASIAAASSDNHDYTVTSGKILHLRQIESSASGKAKMVLQIETGVATGVFTTKAAQFNSTATADMSLVLSVDLLVAAGVRVRVIMSNRDLLPQDLYSSIIGFEI